MLKKTLMAAATLALIALGATSPVSAHDRNDNWDKAATGTMAGTGRTTTSTTITVTSRSLTTSSTDIGGTVRIPGGSSTPGSRAGTS